MGGGVTITRRTGRTTVAKKDLAESESVLALLVARAILAEVDVSEPASMQTGTPPQSHQTNTVAAL